MRLLLIFGTVVNYTSISSPLELNSHGKECAKNVGISETVLKEKIFGEKALNLNDDIYRQICLCLLEHFIGDDNEIIADDKLFNYAELVFGEMFKSKFKSPEIAARKIVQLCKDIKGDSKTDTAAKAVKCVITNSVHLSDKNKH